MHAPLEKFDLSPAAWQLCDPARGPAGAGNLNLLLQEALTPSRDGALERRFGDKVTQLRNNYDKDAAGVFNGTVGVITAMSPEDHTLTVRRRRRAGRLRLRR